MGTITSELRHEQRYDYVLPDLNGRRYLNYTRAAELARMCGEDASDLISRAKDLKRALLRAWSCGAGKIGGSISRPIAATKELRYTSPDV